MSGNEIEISDGMQALTATDTLKINSYFRNEENAVAQSVSGAQADVGTNIFISKMDVFFCSV